MNGTRRVADVLTGLTPKLDVAVFDLAQPKRKSCRDRWSWKLLGFGGSDGRGGPAPKMSSTEMRSSGTSGGEYARTGHQNTKLTPRKVTFAARLTHGAHFELGTKKRYRSRPAGMSTMSATQFGLSWDASAMPWMSPTGGFT